MTARGGDECLPIIRVRQLAEEWHISFSSAEEIMQQSLARGSCVLCSNVNRAWDQVW